MQICGNIMKSNCLEELHSICKTSRRWAHRYLNHFVHNVRHKVLNLSVGLLRGVGLCGALIGRCHHRGDGGGRVQFIIGGWGVQSGFFNLLGQR